MFIHNEPNTQIEVLLSEATQGAKLEKCAESIKLTGCFSTSGGKNNVNDLNNMGWGLYYYSGAPQ